MVAQHLLDASWLEADSGLAKFYMLSLLQITKKPALHIQASLRGFGLFRRQS
jgi:hypothetical protein